jgi:outer membrane protein
MYKYLIAMTLWATQAVAQQGLLTLAECISTTHANNLEVKQGEWQVEAGLVNWQQAKANRLPQLNGSIGYGTRYGRSIDVATNAFVNEQVSNNTLGLNANVTIFGGMQLNNAVKQGATNVQASQMDVQQLKDQLTLRVVLAYLQVLSNDEQVNVAQSQVQASQKQVERLEVMVKEGASPVASLLELKAQWANDKLAVVTAQNAARLAKVTLLQLMNVPVSQSVQVQKLEAMPTAQAYEATTQQLYDTALRTLAAVKGADLRIESAEWGVAIAKGNYYPSLNLGGGIQTLYSSAAPVKFLEQYNNNQNKGFGLNLNIPIFNGHLAKNRVSLAKVQYKNAQTISQQVRLQLRQQIEVAYQNFDAALNRLQAVQEQVQWQEEAFKMAEVRFENGAINAADYVLAKSRLDQARLNLVQARFEYVFRTKMLDFYAGKAL